MTTSILVIKLEKSTTVHLLSLYAAHAWKKKWLFALHTNSHQDDCVEIMLR